MKKIHTGLTKIQMTFGGGMGGSAVTGYATKVEKSSDNLWVIHFVGNTIGPLEVNPQYIVYMQPGYDVYEYQRVGCTDALYAINQLKEANVDQFESWASEKSNFSKVTFPY